MRLAAVPSGHADRRPDRQPDGGNHDRDHHPTLRLCTDGRIRHDGRDHRRLELVNPDTYVLFGSAKSVDSPAITTVIDPQLPAWLSSEILAFTPRLLDVYASKLGPRSGAKPKVYGLSG